MKNNNQVDISLVFFFIAFFIIILGLFSKLSFQKDTVVQTPLSLRKNNTKSLIKLNYNLPILCDYQTKDSSISAAIDINSITATVTGKKDSQRYVVQGDCLYSWNTHEFKGKKKCGIGSSITIGKQLLGSGLGSVDSLTSMFQKSKETSMINFQAVFESCKNVREIKKEVFVIPKEIKFE